MVDSGVVDPVAKGYEPFRAETSWAYLRAAWRDMVGSPGCALALVLLGLVNCVPVLGFAVQGYALRWSRELSFGRSGPLPSSPLGGRAFLTGLQAVVVMIPYAMVLGLALGLLMLVASWLGLIVSVPVLVMFAVFANVCCIRMAVVGRMGAAFDIKAIRWAMRGGKGLYAATFCPPIAAFAVSLGLSALVAFAADPGALANFAFIDAVGSPYEFWRALSCGDVSPIMAVPCAASMFLLAASSVLTVRAVGHWTAFEAPGWADEAVPPREQKHAEREAERQRWIDEYGIDPCEGPEKGSR